MNFEFSATRFLMFAIPLSHSIDWGLPQGTSHTSLQGMSTTSKHSLDSDSPTPASSESFSSEGTSSDSGSQPLSEVSEETSEESCYICEDVPGKGRGLRASRPLKRGELLFSEPPILSFPMSPAPANSRIMMALSQCSREQQQYYFSLHNAFKGKKKVLPALGIFLTNYMPFNQPEDEEGGEWGGIFLFASYFNSSCTPNTSRYWDADRRRMAFRTLRDIAGGEELCFNYGDILATKAERMEELLTERGFECRCEACDVDGEEAEKIVAESDERRTTISRLYDEVGGCGNEPTLGLRMIKKALRLLKEERLVHYESSFCFDAFQFCIMVSDFANAKLWIRRAYDVALCAYGPESDAARMKMYWANPKAHPLNGVLPKAVLSGPD